MCQAYEGEARFLNRLEERHGVCPGCDKIKCFCICGSPYHKELKRKEEERKMALNSTGGMEFDI